jgi:transformer-2 protein
VQASNVLGVFGLSQTTEKAELEDVFAEYGEIDHIDLILDRQTGRSRGFGFVYYETERDATRARKNCNGTVLSGRKIRVDYSMTKRAHAPTPGQYLGKATNRRSSSRSRSPRRRSRSPPRRRRSRSRSR